jgi:hypothetical protein
MCKSLGVCDEDLIDAYVDAHRTFRRELLTKEEAKHHAPITTIEDLVILIAGRPISKAPSD